METNQCYGGRCYSGAIPPWHYGGNSYGCGGDGCCCSDESDYAEELVDMAMSSKKALLREKIKTRLETKLGKKLDKLADLAVEMLLNEWDTEKKESEKSEEFEKKMNSAMWDNKDQN